MKTLKPIPGFSKYGITKCARPVNLKTKRTTIALQREYLRPGGVVNNTDDISDPTYHTAKKQINVEDSVVSAPGTTKP